VYGHLVEDEGRTWLQYWLFYAYNPQDRGLLNTGRHEGDWELVQVRLGPDGEPDRATFVQHSWAESCDWDDVEYPGDASGVPVVYVANGSHASYPRPGVADRPWPDPNDEADGDGRVVRPPLTELTDSSPAWVGYEGRWGGSEAGPVPGEQSSPRGPRFQPDRRFFEPAALDADARECGSGPPGRPWQSAGVGAIAVLVGLLVGLVLRRRRP
jgi:uncharacterized protein (TIGR03382 family)